MLAPQLEAALNVSIESPLDDSCFRVDTAILVKARYTCDQPGCSLIFKVDGIQKSSVSASQGVDIQQVFVWDANSPGVFTLTVELRKTGCYSASASIEATIFSVGISGKSLLAKGKSTSLTAAPTPGGLNGTYSWSVIQGSDKINLAGSGNTISVNGLNVSGMINDVTVKVEFTAAGASAAAAATHSLTVFDLEISEGGPNPPDPYIPAGGKRTYLAIVAPTALDEAGPYTWSKSPSETAVISLYPVGYSCEVRTDTYQTGAAALKARFDPGEGAYAEDSLEILVFRPNIVVGEIGEEAETDTGAYLAKGGTRSCLLQLEGTLPVDETVTLTCDKTGKVSLWEGETQKSFPYQCAVSALPKNLALKGEAVSDTIRDITLTLTTSSGGEDKVKATVVRAEITVFRPQTFPFNEYEIPEDKEENPGAGIRINGDDDNENDVADREDVSVDSENDLIKVKLEVIGSMSAPTGFEYVLKRSNGNIKVWENGTKGTAVLNTNDEQVLTFSGSTKDVWVESPNGGTADLYFQVRRISDGVISCEDKVHFYGFSSCIIVLGGEGQTPSDDSEYGTFILGKILYLDGYDVHMFDEDKTYTEVEPEVRSAIEKRGVITMIVFGYSHGGGSTYIIAKYLVDEELATENTIVYTAYTDAVTNTLPWFAPETRRPPGSLYLTNRYELNTFLIHGDSVPNTEDEVNLTDLDLTHYNIDDYEEVINNIRSVISGFSP